MEKCIMEISRYDSYKKIRKKWNKNPSEIVHKDKRKKSRSQQKIEFKKELE